MCTCCSSLSGTPLIVGALLGASAFCESYRASGVAPCHRKRANNCCAGVSGVHGVHRGPSGRSWPRAMWSGVQRNEYWCVPGRAAELSCGRDQGRVVCGGRALGIWRGARLLGATAGPLFETRAPQISGFGKVKSSSVTFNSRDTCLGGRLRRPW